MKKTHVYLSVIAILLLAGCANVHVRLMPGENENRAVARSDEKEDAEEAALEKATEYCQEQKKSIVVLKDQVKYTGNLEETTRNTIRNASEAAQVLGAFTSVGDAGTAGAIMTSDQDYMAEIVFQCK